MKILIVDDEALVRRSLARAASSRGHDSREAGDGKEGEGAWREYGPDVVFLDVLMPRRSGPELLKAMSPTSAKVILMSAYTGGYDLAKAQALGADLFCAKPFEDIFKIIELAEGLYSHGSK